MLKRTALFAAHQRLGARLVEFGGWEMPLYYSGIVDEHLAVRKAAGIFDISHMGEIQAQGPEAEAFLNRLLTNDTRKLSVGEGQYTLLCNERGGVIDDLYLYRLGPENYLAVVNAARLEPDWAWFQAQHEQFPLRESVVLANASAELGALAIQGPKVAEFVEICVPGASTGGTPVTRATALRKNQVAAFNWNGAPIHLARTGYTGEDGFELLARAEELEPIWDRFLAVGRDFGLQPAGLGARDTLRTEVCYPLYGHELNEQTTPLEAGLGFFVALEKGAFIGRAALAEQKLRGLSRKCVAFKMVEKTAPPRPGYPIWSRADSSAPAGQVVSGTQSPSLGIGIGLGYVPVELGKPGNEIDIEIRGGRHPARIVAKPIYRPGG